MFSVKPTEIRKGDTVWYRSGGQGIKSFIATSGLINGQVYYPVEEGDPRCGSYSVYLSQIVEVTREYQAGDWKDA